MIGGVEPEAGSRTAVFAALKQTLETDFDLAGADLTPEAHLVDDLDLDSLDVVALGHEIQGATGVTLANEDFRAVATLGDLVSLVASRLDAAGD